MHTSNWGDLQYVLAVAEGGSLVAAARTLRVNHTTVLRRVRDFEKRLGVRLFERLPQGYVLTPGGEDLVTTSRRIRDAVLDLENRVVGRDLQLDGTVRVTTTDTLATAIVPRALSRFVAEHPAMNLELTTTTSMANLTKREADIAVRPTTKPSDNLVGRRVADLAYAPYAAPSYLARVPARRALNDHTWLAPDDSIASSTVGRWMARELSHARVAFRADTLSTLAHHAAAGLGVVALPCYFGDGIAHLRRIREVIPDMTAQLWVLTHEDLRAVPRIRALTDWLFRALGEERALFEGKRRDKGRDESP